MKLFNMGCDYVFRFYFYISNRYGKCVFSYYVEL